MWSGTGGATDYAYGAYHSKGGRAMLCQISTAKKGTVSRIAPILDPGSIVSVSRNLTDMVVTEYGVAKLRARTVKQRVENLIAVAHPGLPRGTAEGSQQVYVFLILSKDLAEFKRPPHDCAAVSFCNVSEREYSVIFL